MNKFNKKNLKLAVQKGGRLTDETLDLLRAAGLEFESYRQRLFSTCRNFPLEILYLRDDDIPDYVNAGIVDLGIVGQNLLYEKRTNVKKLLNLRYGFCTLAISVLKESSIESVDNLKNKKVATSYPNTVKTFFKKKNIPIDVVEISGSVEITPTLGVASAIVDLVSTGSTLALNDLRLLETIFESEAVLIANPQSLANSLQNKLISQLLMRFEAVLSAKKYKYVMMNAPEQIIPRLKKTIPGLKSPTISPLAQTGWVSVQTVIKEDVFWETVERMKKLGATGIIILPIEKLII